MVDKMVSALDRIVVGSVAITARAIASTDAELTFMQWRVLVVVGERDGESSVGEIASRMGAHASPASRVISRLKRRGLVRTYKDSQDARVTRVTLTDAGWNLRARVLAQRTRDLTDMLEILAIGPTEIGTVERLARTFEPFA